MMNDDFDGSDMSGLVWAAERSDFGTEGGGGGLADVEEVERVLVNIDGMDVFALFSRDKDERVVVRGRNTLVG